MEASILKSIKKVLGLGPDYTIFDPDVIMHINTVFSTLHQLGIGPPEGFQIEDDAEEWTDFLLDDPVFNSVKTYIFLRVKMLFDPPGTSFHLTAIKEQIQELEWRINVQREGDTWLPPLRTAL